MTCHEVSATIDAYLDGELSADDEATVSRHVETCGSCRKQLDERKALSLLLRRMPYYDAPSQVQAKVSSAHSSLSTRRRVQTWMAAAAVIALAVGAKSPIPATAALLARERRSGKPYVSLLGSRAHTFFTDGSRELFDCA